LEKKAPSERGGRRALPVDTTLGRDPGRREGPAARRPGSKVLPEPKPGHGVATPRPTSTSTNRRTVSARR